MPRPLKLDRPKRIEIYLPQSIYSALQEELFSELEGKVPHGRASEVVTTLVKNWLASRGAIL